MDRDTRSSRDSEPDLIFFAGRARLWVKRKPLFSCVSTEKTDAVSIKGALLGCKTYERSSEAAMVPLAKAISHRRCGCPASRHGERRRKRCGFTKRCRSRTLFGAIRGNSVSDSVSRGRRIAGTGRFHLVIPEFCSYSSLKKKKPSGRPVL